MFCSYALFGERPAKRCGRTGAAGGLSVLTRMIELIFGECGGEGRLARVPSRPSTTASTEEVALSSVGATPAGVGAMPAEVGAVCALAGA